MKIGHQSTGGGMGASRLAAASLLALAMAAGGGVAQGAPSADTALGACGAAVRAGERSAAESAAEEALAIATRIESDRPADALEVRARVLIQCRIPFAPFLRRGELLEAANGLLREALGREPAHLGARFSLAMNHYHSPAFLGRTDDAIRELERLLADHGGSSDPRVAVARGHLAELYERTGRSAEAADARAAEGPAPALPGYTLDPIVVEAGGYSMEDPRTATRLSRTEVYTMPGGTADVLQVFQTLPGVTQVTDGSDLYVRGGDPAETPVYVDGARLFYPGRFETLNGSLFGVLDPSVMRRAYFSSGGFSARYGNALSGVVELETDGRPVQPRWRAGLNLATLGGSMWRPAGDRAGIWGTAAVTRTDALLRLHGRSDDYPTSPRSLQGMIGLAAEPRDGLDLRVTALAEADRTVARVSSHGHDGPFRSRAATRLATAQARALSRDGRRGLRLSLSASMRDSGFRFGVLDRDREDRGAGVRLDGDMDRGRVHLRGGLEGARLTSVVSGVVPAGPAVAPGSPVTVLDRDETEAHHLGGYGEVEARVAQRLAVIAGLRVDALPGEDGLSVDPRLAAAYRLDEWTLRAGAGIYSQGRWRIRSDVPDAGRPSGVPLRARHLAAGVQRDGPVAFRAEAYLKEYDDYVGQGDGPALTEGRAAGLDVLVRWSGVGRVSGWLTYSLLDGELELADGGRVPSAYDVTHTAAAVARIAVGNAWEVGFTGRYATGRPFTPITGAESTPEGVAAPIYGRVHSERLPDYVRLDGRLTRVVPLSGGVLVGYLEGLNLLDRRNVMAYTYDADYRNRHPVDSFFAQRTLVLGMEAQF
jgi:vitamin B12 transporter